jgi:hypothetical protein
MLEKGSNKRSNNFCEMFKLKNMLEYLTLESGKKKYI